MWQQFLASDLAVGVRAILPLAIRQRILQIRFEKFINRTTQCGQPDWLVGALEQMIRDYPELDTRKNRDHVYRLELAYMISLFYIKAKASKEWFWLAKETERVLDVDRRASLLNWVHLEAYKWAYDMKGDHVLALNREWGLLQEEPLAFYDKLMAIDLRLPIAAWLAKMSGGSQQMVETLLLRQVALICQEANQGKRMGCGCCTYADHLGKAFGEKHPFAQSIDAAGIHVWDGVIMIAIHERQYTLAADLASHKLNDRSRACQIYDIQERARKKSA